MDEEPSLLSRRHPARLLFRSVLLVLAAPVVLWIAVEKFREGDTTTAWLGGGFGVAFLVFGGVHLLGALGGGKGPEAALEPMQLVNAECATCGERIRSIRGGGLCVPCGQAHHHNCLPDERNDECPSCGEVLTD